LANFHQINLRHTSKDGDLHDIVKRGVRREEEEDEKLTECVQDKDIREYVYTARNQAVLGEPLVLGQPVL
jgi:hypothetical protein